MSIGNFDDIIDSKLLKSVFVLSRTLFYPFLAVMIYAFVAYLDTNYVVQSHYNTFVEKNDLEHSEVVKKLEDNFKTTDEKLDKLLLINAGVSQKFINLERRVARLEDHLDRL